MKQTLTLLDTPEKRPVNEAIIWYKDGWRLLKEHSAGWAVYMIASVLLLLAVLTTIDLVIGLLAQSIPAFTRLGLLIIFIVSAWVVLSLQTGLYRSMARITKGGKVNVEDLFWGFSQWRNQQFWFFIFMVSLMNISFQWIENHFVGQVYQFDVNHPGQILINQDKLAMFLGLNTAYWALLSLLTWAILPTITDFPTQSFAQAFKRNLYGSLNNLLALVYLGALMLLTVLVIAGVVAALSAFIHPMIAATFFLLTSLWGVPLFNGWLFSAYRHIFTEW